MESYLTVFQDLNMHFTSCTFINLDFLVPNVVHFHNNIVLPLLVFETFGFILSVTFLHFNW